MKYLTLLFIAFLSFIILSANQGTAGRLFGFLYHFPGGDKVGHLLLMGMFSFLVNLSLQARTTRLGRMPILTGTLIVLAVVTVEEITQIFLDNRSFSFIDLAFDYVGILLFGHGAALLVRRQHRAAT